MEQSQPLLKTLMLILIVVLLILISPKGGTYFYVHNIRWIYVFIMATGFSLFLIPIVKYLAVKFRIMDFPAERKIHRKPIPLLGGLAIYIALVLTIIRNLNFNPELKGIVIGGAIIFILGLVDDIWGLSARYKLVGQIAATLVIIRYGVVITVIPHWPGEHIIEILLTIIGVVGVINAFNYFDGMDGLAAGLGIISSFCFFIFALQTGQRYLAWLAIALLGACMGFLPYNWKPAQLFLGDSGSNFIGFNLAALAIMGSWKVENPLVACVVPVLILSVYIFDMIYTTVSRIKNKRVHNVKEWLEYTGKDHLHHRLVKLGMSEVGTVLIICALSLTLGIGAIVLRGAGAFESVFLFIQAVLIFLIIVVLMLTGREIR
ncbi:MAG: undecaprenyl/decaprenyl-phosphate alpha-N-acetylglucosaminyl 1-phosphate transferase [Elusimicrobia bacterium]|nr:undecaprenyl/decaprenyl-phosphate alpha-N-acetylglucosaminyl 1-phosphate transferase [Elusimicrobiota bacterium]